MMTNIAHRWLLLASAFVAIHTVAAATRNEFDCVYLNEVCWSNTRIEDGAGNFESDWVELYNPRDFSVNVGGYAIGLKGTWLESESAGKLFVLPSYSMPPRSFLLVFFNKDYAAADTGLDSARAIIRTKAFSLGKNGDKTQQDSVRLFAPTLHTRVSNFKDVPVLADNSSYGWVYDGTFDPYGRQNTSLRVFSNPTPGYSNTSGGVPILPDPTLMINEVCYSNSTVDDGTGNKDCDFVELYNPGPDAVYLGGMKLGKKATVADCGDAVFRFPDYLLEPGEFFVVFFNKDVAPSSTNVTRLVNGVEKSVPLIRSNALSLGKGESTEVPGSVGTNVVVQDSVRLFAADGRRIANFKGEDVAAAVGVVRNPETGAWEALVEKNASVGPKTDGGTDLAEFYQPTPWGPNSAGSDRPTAVVINEVCYGNTTVDDGTGNFECDWVELYNTGPESVQLSGMKLGKKSTLEKCEDAVFTFPEYELSSNEFLVVFFDKNLAPATTVMTRKVNGVDKSVKVFRSNAFSLGTDTSDEVPGYEGRYVLVQDSVRLFAADGTRLSNYKGEDIAEAVGVKTVGTMLSAVLEEGQTFGYLWDGNRLPSGEAPPDAEKGRVVLSHETSWGPNGAGYVFAAPSVSGSVPGRYADAQDIAFASETAQTVRYTTDGSDPRVSPTAITCAVGETVTIGAAAPSTATSGGSLTNAWIRTSPVELAANEPNAAWSAPIGSVGRASAVRAVAVKGPAYSAEWRGTWYVGPDFAAQTLPLVSVIADEADVFSDEKGIYVPGSIYKTNAVGYGSNKWGKPYANYYGDGEVPAHVELVECGAGAEALALDAGLAINGGGTRSLPQKALYVKMKTAYGDRSFTYDLIPAVGERTYRRFLLRPDGNDWYGPYTAGVSTMMKDAVFHRIVSGLDMYTMAYRPAVVYLNGSYWGIHNVRESVDKQAFATRYGLNEDLIDVLTHEDAGSSGITISLIDGSENAVSEYRSWLQSVRDNDITSATRYRQYVTDKMDVTNFIDYICTECFYANTDWPNNNCDFWRSRAGQASSAGKYGDGRWRWALYDLDLAGLVVDGVGGVNRNMLTYLSGSNMSGFNRPGFLINRLWLNAAFKDEFIRRYTELLNTTFRPERIESVVTAAANEIEGEIETHYRRWGREFSTADWRSAVTSALVDYTAQRWTNCFTHASAKFELGGVGELRVMNSDPSGVGGHFVVDGTVIDAGTDGVTDRADWTGRYYPSRPVTIVAVPDAGYAFDGWVGSTETSASRQVAVTANGRMQFKARFRPISSTNPVLASPAPGFSAWQAANCDEQAVLRDESAVQPGALAVSKGGRDYTNFELFAFGVTRQEAESLSAEELKSRTSLRILGGDGMALEYGCSPYGGIETQVKVASSLSSGVWRTAEVGADVGPAETNKSSSDCWTVTVPLMTNRGEDFYRLEIEGDGR